MADESMIVDVIRERQHAMRRAFDKRRIAMKIIADDSGVDYKTLLTYFPADKDKVPAQIPGSVIYALAGNVPENILSYLLPPTHVVVRVPEGVDHDELAAACADYLREKQKAHQPDSPAGRDISPCEDDKLRARLAAVRGQEMAA